MKSYTFEVFTQTPTAWHRPGKGEDGQRYKISQDVDEQARIKMAWLETFRFAPLYTQPCRLAVTVFLKCPKATPKYKRKDPYFLPMGDPDWDNYTKQAADALEGLALANDNVVVTGLGRKRWALDAEGNDTPPRWVITLEVIEEGDDVREEGRFAATWGWDRADQPQRAWGEDGGRRGSGLSESGDGGEGVPEDGFAALPALQLDES